MMTADGGTRWWRRKAGSYGFLDDGSSFEFLLLFFFFFSVCLCTKDFTNRYYIADNLFDLGKDLFKI